MSRLHPTPLPTHPHQQRPSSPASILVPSIRLTSATPSSHSHSHSGPGRAKSVKSVRIVDPPERERVAPWEGKAGTPYGAAVSGSTKGANTNKLGKGKGKEVPKDTRTTRSGFRVFVDPAPRLPRAVTDSKEREKEKEKARTISNPRSVQAGAASSRIRTHSQNTLASFTSATTTTTSTLAKPPLKQKSKPVGTLAPPPTIEVKKSRSRLGLDALRNAWGGGGGGGALGDVTNVGREEREMEKERGGEKDKWWSLGRRGGEKAKERAASPAPTLTAAPTPKRPTPAPKISILLDPAPRPMTTFLTPPTPSSTSLHPNPNSNLAQPSRPTTHRANTLAVPSHLHEKENREREREGRDGSGSGSIAVRAMRSVRSLARIGSWAALGRGPSQGQSHEVEDDAQPTSIPTSTSTSKSQSLSAKVKAKDEKAREKENKKGKAAALLANARDRGLSVSSGSSWEVGAPSDVGGSPLRSMRGSPARETQMMRVVEELVLASPSRPARPAMQHNGSSEATVRPAVSHWNLGRLPAVPVPASLRRAKSSGSTVGSGTESGFGSPVKGLGGGGGGRTRPGLKGLFEGMHGRGKGKEKEKEKAGQVEEEWEELERGSGEEIEVERVAEAPRRERKRSASASGTPRRRPVSEGRLLEVPRNSGDISTVAAATSELSDLIARLDLSTTTPDCSPAKSLRGPPSTARKPQPSPLRPITPASLTGTPVQPVPSVQGTFGKLGTLPSLASIRARHAAAAARTNTTETPTQLHASTFGRSERQAWMDCMPGAFGIVDEVSRLEEVTPAPTKAVRREKSAVLTPSPTPLRIARVASSNALPSGSGKAAGTSTLAPPGISMVQMTPDPTPLRIPSAPLPPHNSVRIRPLTDRLSTSSTASSIADSMLNASVSSGGSAFRPHSPLLYRNPTAPRRASRLSTEITFPLVEHRGRGRSDSDGSEGPLRNTMGVEEVLARSPYASSNEGMSDAEDDGVAGIPEELREILRQGELMLGPISPPPALPLPPAPTILSTRKGLSTSSSTRLIGASTSSDGSGAPAAHCAADTEESCGGSPMTDEGSFDFTGELDRLNEAGTRMSFVRELETAFRTPGEGFRTALEWGVQEMEAVEEVPGEESLIAREEAMLSIGDLMTRSDERESPAVSAEEEKEQQPEQAPHHAPDDSFAALDSMYADKLVGDTRLLDITMPTPLRTAPSLMSDGSSKRGIRRDAPVSVKRGHSRQESAISVATMSSVGDVRSVGAQDPFGFVVTQVLKLEELKEASTAAESKSGSDHARQESQASIPSISSYGALVKGGVPNPFGYASSERSVVDVSMSMIHPLDAAGIAALDDARRAARFKRSNDSDVSKWSFHAGPVSHHREDSSMSNISYGPPISLHNPQNVSFLNRVRGDSADSMSSVAHAYGTFGANGGRIAWARHGHAREESSDSIMSAFSFDRLGRPGMTDKMFDSAMAGAPLDSILASPDPSEAGDMARSSFDSIMDERRSSIDSLFDNPGRASSISSNSVFGGDDRPSVRLPAIFQPRKGTRPVSMVSNASSDAREDDTVITMIGGEHALGRPIGTVFANSPCVLAEKRKQTAPLKPASVSPALHQQNEQEVVSRSSMDSFKFGGQRMTKTLEGVLQRPSLEDVALQGEGQNETGLVPTPQFFRPLPASVRKKRAVGSTPTPIPLLLNTIPPDTPPYSASEAGSQSSIDMSRLKVILENSTPTGVAMARARARGHGHRRQLSRGSAIETIEEETPGLSNSPPRASGSISSASEVGQDENDLDQQQAASRKKWLDWQEEVYTTLRESAEQFQDTDFSRYALATFRPPRRPSAILAYVEYSRKTYAPLYVRRRTRSRPKFSPYPLPEWDVAAPPRRPNQDLALSPEVLASLKTGLNLPDSPGLALAGLDPTSKIPVMGPSTFEHRLGSEPSATEEAAKPAPRPRVKSDVRRQALGWSRRKDVNMPAVPKRMPVGTSTAVRKENSGPVQVTSPARTRPKVRPSSRHPALGPLRL